MQDNNSSTPPTTNTSDKLSNTDGSAPPLRPTNGGVEPTPASAELVLTKEQEFAVNHIVTRWFPERESPLEFSLGGYAGVGKTTVIKEIVKRMQEAYGRHLYGNKVATRVASFTGKAVSVLRRKGVPEASTLHSLMYLVDVDETTHKVSFSKRYILDPMPSLIIVDEASMISTELWNDLKHFGHKLLYVGDPGQLEPVGDNPNLMKNPKITLCEIHRQAKESPILKLAHHVRTGGRIEYQSQPGLAVITKADLANQPITDEFQLICGLNKQRTSMNAMIRGQLGRTGLVSIGEKVICVQNNRTHGLFNGQIMFVDKIHEDNGAITTCDVHDELGAKRFAVPMFNRGFGSNFDLKSEKLPNPETCLFDYGYCITCHKAQGSEWDNVVVLEQYMGFMNIDMKRWAYTAITRAAKNLIYVR